MPCHRNLGYPVLEGDDKVCVPEVNGGEVVVLSDPADDLDCRCDPEFLVRY